MEGLAVLFCEAFQNVLVLRLIHGKHLWMARSRWLVV
jgi:hypothetical protein